MSERAHNNKRSKRSLQLNSGIPKLSLERARLLFSGFTPESGARSEERGALPALLEANKRCEQIEDISIASYDMSQVSNTADVVLRRDLSMVALLRALLTLFL